MIPKKGAFFKLSLQICSGRVCPGFVKIKWVWMNWPSTSWHFLSFNFSYGWFFLASQTDESISLRTEYNAWNVLGKAGYGSPDYFTLSVCFDSNSLIRPITAYMFLFALDVRVSLCTRVEHMHLFDRVPRNPMVNHHVSSKEMRLYPIFGQTQLSYCWWVTSHHIPANQHYFLAFAVPSPCLACAASWGAGAGPGLSKIGWSSF